MRALGVLLLCAPAGAVMSRRRAAMVASPSKWRRHSKYERDVDVGPDHVFGVSPVLNALTRGGGRRDAYRLYVQDSIDIAKRKDKGAVLRIQRAAEAARIPVLESDKGRMNALTGNRPHQGFVLEASPIEFIPIDRLDDAPSVSDDTRQSVWLALDEVRSRMSRGRAGE